jgi:hypothetical protein
MNTIRYSLLTINLILLVGCSPRSTPSDLPALYPCAITVIQDGKPLTGGVVMLSAVDKNQKFGSASAETDSNGVAALRTYGEPGVPLGAYKIIVLKTVSEGQTERTDPAGMKYFDGGTDYSRVDKKFIEAETSPLEITITAGKNAQTADVGKAGKWEIGGKL